MVVDASARRPWRLPACVFAAVLLRLASVAAAPAVVGKKASFHVRSEVVSGWPQTPAAAQSLEWLRDVSTEDAKEFLLQLAAEGSASGEVSTTATSRLHAGSARTFHELLVRNVYYSPRIEMARSLERGDRGAFGSECPPTAAWVLLWPLPASPVAVCDSTALRAALADKALQQKSKMAGSFVQSSSDLVLRTGSPDAVAVLYGALSDAGLSTLAPLVKELMAYQSGASGDVDWTIIFRHGQGPAGKDGPGADMITGFGLELAIKSSEYKTHADEEKKDEPEEAEQEAAADEDDSSADAGEGAEREVEKRELSGPLEIDGLQFHTLLDRYPKLRSRLWVLKEQLEAEQDTDAVLKAWEIKDIGLQATAKILASPAPLVALMRTSQNFPALVGSLVKSSKVTDKLRKHYKTLRNVVREGTEIFGFNNRMVRADHAELSLFPLVKTLLPFFVGVERMVRQGVPEKVACEILKESFPASRPDRVDWRSPNLPPKLYEVRKDKKSSNWGTSLMELMYTWPGSLARVRMALYNIVHVFDPAEIGQLRVAMVLLGQLPLPLSLTLAMVPEASGSISAAAWNEETLGKAPEWVASAAGTAAADAPGAAGHRVGHKIAACYGYLLAVKQAKARNFLKHLVEEAEAFKSEDKEQTRWPSSEAGVSKVKKAFAKAFGKNETHPDPDAIWDAVVDGSAENSDHAKAAAQYLGDLGAPVPSMLINGRLLIKNAIESIQSVFQNIAMEQQYLQQGVSRRQEMMSLPPENVEAAVADLMGPYVAAYHEEITPEIAQRGGEESFSGSSSKIEAKYLLWPSSAFSGLQWLQSVPPPAPEETSGASDGSAGEPLQRLQMYHVVVIRRLGESYLLQAFAAHLLAQDKEAESYESHWAAVLDVSGAPNEAERSAMGELQRCLRGALSLQPAASAGEDLLPDEVALLGETLNRRKLQLLKFLGSAVPAAGQAAMQPGRIAQLCEMAIEKKLDPDSHAEAKAAVSPKAEKNFERLAADEAIIVDAAKRSLRSRTASALWVCNGREIVLESSGRPLFARHIRTLEMMESQYDTSTKASDDGEEGGEKEAPAKGLQDWLAEAKDDAGKALVLPEKTLGLIAAIRSEALAAGKGERVRVSKAIMDVTPKAFQLNIPPVKPDAASPIKVFGVLDPLSTTAQSASAVLALFGMAFNAEVTLIFNPVGRHSEYPLKRYYREVIRWPDRLADGSLASELEGGQVGGGKADFTLATRHALTAAVHALPTWLVTAQKAPHDMDNLRIQDVGDGEDCNVTYVLRQLYVEGQALILGDDGWPQATAKGLQLEIGPKGGLGQAKENTMVMGNLGYFQVHGNPGLHEVTLKAGVSNESFEAVSLEALEVSSYITPPYQLRVRARPGHSANALSEKGAKEGRGQDGSSSSEKTGGLSKLLGGLSGLFGGDAAGAQKTAGGASADKPSQVADGGAETIHIFSVASGHLYEKLLGIMILSVRSQTKSPLHFWFIDQFLSPSFKAIIPKLAERYDFAFDFVTYKWPSWLNPQSEKQRLIWAYKILFLDVLFPQDVPKVIFIDADQVVRADVRELWETDLQGKVYGFTPMCDSNTAVEGFRFWKQGYWKNHLRGLPYHISALFVVDLKEFRRRGMGDALRGIYNQLSQDPNSLANLDQDLPNFAQHQIGIHSLPQEWLWCETWCSQETKTKAKTIDLCQNPLTKEPKIVMAKRIISEWQTYHDEVARFQEELFNTPAAAADGATPRQRDAAAAAGSKAEL
eukprot:TRINITY_DN37670_c1_g1_i1.p1 TRINITY_DN37670_c1_g1~~TRINITY_DN37670_c1_g1_i1.p1  ORF type:complete len:1741 (+),score=483.89 TRINITY_DN37670_c1_g1_i1:87-5309(+)